MTTAPSVAENRAMIRTLKQRGYVVQVGAPESLFDGYAKLRREFGTLSEFLTRVLDTIAGSAKTTILTADVVCDAVDRLEADLLRAAGTPTAALDIIDVFGLAPPRSFDISAPSLLAPQHISRPDSSSYNISLSSMPGLIDGLANTKANLFRTRYQLTLNKILRNQRFAPPASTSILRQASSRQSPYLQLTAIDSLKGTHGDRLVLGMLTQLEEDNWYLEDLNGSVKVDLSQARATAGLHTESSFIIAQGQLLHNSMDEEEDANISSTGHQIPAESPIFKVFAMGTPPMESRDISTHALGRDANLFGGHYEPADHDALLKLEQDSSDAVFLVISDVFLDSPRVFNGLRTILAGYLDDGVVPTAIILIGNFLSHPFGQRSSDPRELAAAFSALGQMIADDFPLVADSSSFIIVPGPNDAGPGNVVPRPAIPRMLTDGFKSALKSDSVFFASNPCRIRYMTQEIVIFRENLLHKMLRHCAIRPDLSDTDHIAEHLVKSIVDQAHLCPLPISSRPVFWCHDHAMWLFPSPHLVVVADKVEGYSYQYGETLGMNPGSFGSDLSFSIYTPADRRCQQCTLNHDELESNLNDVASKTSIGSALETSLALDETPLAETVVSMA